MGNFENRFFKTKRNAEIEKKREHNKTSKITSYVDDLILFIGCALLEHHNNASVQSVLRYVTNGRATCGKNL